MLHQRLAAYMWWGVVINIVAMVLVSVTNFLAPDDALPDGTANSPALGAFFILMSCVVQASERAIGSSAVSMSHAWMVEMMDRHIGYLRTTGGC